MVSLYYKLCGAERKDLISSCIVRDGRETEYRIESINDLPYGYLVHFKSGKDRYSFVLNVHWNGKGKEARVIPGCDFAKIAGKTIQSFLNKKSKGI